MFRKILVANRGEIAVRVIRACREMGICSVAVYSEADRASLHVRMADEAAEIGPAPASESYLRIDKILDTAREHGAEAIHPGYGFLSENPELAGACDAAGIVFIGPSADSMRRMGSKTEARAAMQAAGVPILPGSEGPAADFEAAAQDAERAGYPVLIKASAGGGGKGMRLVRAPEELASAFEQARSEAENAFGDGSVYVEKAIERPRHVEVQIVADKFGSIVHLGERECSLQRRHQKVMEETPSPLLEGYPEVREQLCAAAVAAARATDYFSAGTVEFLMDAERNFYFLEMNARLQVEHPITELVSGVDLVQEQIRIAAGKKLGFSQDDVRLRGAAIECRVYAEDPAQGFLPAPGRITSLERPSGPGVRVDSGAYAGWEIPLEYDSLIAKLAVWAPTRPAAIARLEAALREYHIGGVRTTLDFFRAVLKSDELRRGEIDTGFIDRFLKAGGMKKDKPPAEYQAAALLAASRRFVSSNGTGAAAETAPADRWKSLARRRGLR